MSTKTGIQAPRVVRSDRSFYAVTRKVADEAKKNDEAEFELKAIKALADMRTPNLGMRSIRNRVAADPKSLEETLIDSFTLNPATSNKALDATLNQPQNCARVMTKMFLRSLEPDGIDIGFLPQPTATELTDCGFANEAQFMAYFTNDFVPQAVERLSAIPKTSVTLSKKEKDDIIFALENLNKYAHQNVQELREELAVEKKRLEYEEGVKDTTTALAGTSGALRIMARPAVSGSRRAKIEAVLALPDPFLQQRVDYMKMWVALSYGKKNTDRMLEYVNGTPGLFGMEPGIPDYDPEMTFNINGDAAASITVTMKPSDLKKVKVGDDITLNPGGKTAATADHVKLFKAIVDKFDTISTTPELQSAAVNKLDGQPADIGGALAGKTPPQPAVTTVDAAHSDETVLRQKIWDARKKEFDELLKLLPSEDYQLFLQHQGMDALAGRTPIEQLVDFFPKLKLPYKNLGTNINSNQQATLDLIIALENLAKALQAEDAAIKTAGFNFAGKAPDAIESQNAGFLTAREARKKCEAELAAVAEIQKDRIKEKNFIHGDHTSATGQEGYKESKAHIEWERRRIKHQVEVLYNLEPSTLPTKIELEQKLDEFFKKNGGKDWKDNSTDLNGFIDSLGYDPTLVAGPIKAAWRVEKTANMFDALGTGTVDNKDVAVWLIGKLTPLQPAIAFRNKIKKEAAPTEAIITTKLNDPATGIKNWADNATDLNGFIDSLGYDPVAVAGPIKAAWAAEKMGYLSGVENAQFAGWLATKLPKPLPLRPKNVDARALAFDDSKRTQDDRSFVATYVDIKNEGKKPACILASKNFMIGRDGNQLTLAQARLKWIGLLIWDQKPPVDGYHTTAHVPDPANAASLKRADVGGDLGDGRLTTKLNKLKQNDATSAAKQPINESGNIWWKYICEADAHEESPFVTVYWAKVDLGTGDVLQREPIDMASDEGKLLSQEFTKVYEEGMKNDHQVSFEAKKGEENYVHKLTADSDVILRESPEKLSKAANPFPGWKQYAQASAATPTIPVKKNKTNFMAEVREGWKNLFKKK